MVGILGIPNRHYLGRHVMSGEFRGFGGQGQNGAGIGEGVGHQRADFIGGTRHFTNANRGSVKAVLAFFHLSPQFAGGDSELRVEVAADDGGIDVKAQEFRAFTLRL